MLSQCSSSSASATYTRKHVQTHTHTHKHTQFSHNAIAEISATYTCIPSLTHTLSLTLFLSHTHNSLTMLLQSSSSASATYKCNSSALSTPSHFSVSSCNNNKKFSKVSALVYLTMKSHYSECFLESVPQMYSPAHHRCPPPPSSHAAEQTAKSRRAPAPNSVCVGVWNGGYTHTLVSALRTTGQRVDAR